MNMKKFKLDSNNPYFACAEKVSDLYHKCLDYLDSNFSEQINQDPTSKVWELIVCDTLLNKNLSLRTLNNNGGPDFIINDYPTDGNITCIECVAPEPGMDITEPVREDDFVTLRIANSITNKMEQIDKWVASTGINEFYHVLAINTSKLKVRFVNLYNIFGKHEAYFVKTPNGVELEESFTANEIPKYRNYSSIITGSDSMNNKLGMYFHGLVLSNDMPFFSHTIPPYQVSALPSLELELIFRC